MSKLVWDEVGSRFYETGIKNVALYVYDSTTKKYGTGVAWSGVTGITESPSGAEETALYADDTKYLSLYSKEEFGATIEAYTYPEEFELCDGTAEYATGVKIGQQTRKMFALAYVTTEGNDTDGDAFGKKIHIIYGAKASPSEKAYATINDSPEAITFSWELTTTPIQLDGYNDISTLTIDSTKLSEDKFNAVYEALYGTTDKEPAMQMPADIKALVAEG